MTDGPIVQVKRDEMQREVEGLKRDIIALHVEEAALYKRMAEAGRDQPPAVVEAAR